MIVEGISVYSAVLYNILDGYFIPRLIVKNEFTMAFFVSCVMGSSSHEIHAYGLIYTIKAQLFQ